MKRLLSGLVLLLSFASCATSVTPSHELKLTDEEAKVVPKYSLRFEYPDQIVYVEDVMTVDKRYLADRTGGRPKITWSRTVERQGKRLYVELKKSRSCKARAGCMWSFTKSVHILRDKPKQMDWNDISPRGVQVRLKRGHVIKMTTLTDWQLNKLMKVINILRQRQRVECGQIKNVSPISDSSRWGKVISRLEEGGYLSFRTVQDVTRVLKRLVYALNGCLTPQEKKKAQLDAAPYRDLL